MKKYSKLLILAGGIVVAVLAVSLYLHYQSLYPSTDDAYVKANVLQIAPQVNGLVATVDVQNQQTVKKGQVLFTLDPKPFQVEVDQAQAQLENTQKSTARLLTLASKNLISPQAKDQAISDLKVAEANYAKAKLNLAYTVVRAPTNGYIANLTLVQGDALSAYQPVFSVISSETWWVDANYKENDLSRIKPGQKASIKLDMYPDHIFSGVVTSIARGSGNSFSLLPAENATGNWVKVTQRFPVRVMIRNSDQAYPLRIGASATVTINTKK